MINNNEEEDFNEDDNMKKKLNENKIQDENISINSSEDDNNRDKENQEEEEEEDENIINTNKKTKKKLINEDDNKKSPKSQNEEIEINSKSNQSISQNHSEKNNNDNNNNIIINNEEEEESNEEESPVNTNPKSKKVTTNTNNTNQENEHEGKKNEKLTCDEIIELQRNVPDCQLMIEGYRNTLRIFYFCFCDPDCQFPLCETCVRKCHGEHWKNKNFDDIPLEERKAMCHCGQTNHLISDIDADKDFFYKENCLFMEWFIKSKNYIYYENNNTDEILCPFCYACCDCNQADYVRNNFEIKDNNNNIIPKCSCKMHSDYSTVLENFIKLFGNTNKKFNFEGSCINQFIKMLLLSEESFKNAFYNLDDIIPKISDEILNNNFQIENYANNSHLKKALEKIEFILASCKDLYYFGGKNNRLDCSKFIFKLLTTKDTSSSFTNNLIFKKYLFEVYHKLTFRSDFEELPVFTEKDVYNLNPFQRIMLCNYINNFSYKKRYLDTNENAENKNQIDYLLTIIENLKNLKQRTEEAYEILKIIYSELKRFIRYNQLSNEQLVKFFTLNDDLIYISIANKDSDSKTENAQFAMLNQMVKCVLYISYYYNDDIIFKHLMDEIPASKVSFFHCDNEIGKMITKNCTHILLYCKNISNNVQNTLGTTMKTTINPKPLKFLRTLNQKTHYRDEIMFIATSITSLSLNFPDSYQIGLKTLFNKSKEIYISYINNNFTPKEKEIVDKLNERAIRLEKLYSNYFNYIITEEELQNQVINDIDDIFNLLGASDYKIPDIKKSGQPKKKFKFKQTLTLNLIRNKSQQDKTVLKEEEDKKILLSKYKVLINKTPIMFTLLKSLKILIKCTKNMNDYKTIEQNYFDAIFKILYFFVEKNIDNCILVLCKDIIMCFIDFPKLNIEQLFSFIIYILTQILHNSEEITFSQLNYLVKLLKNISSNIKGNLNDYELLENLFRIMSKLAKIKYLNDEHMLNKLRAFIKDCFEKYSIIGSFRSYAFDLYFKKKTLSAAIEEKEQNNGYSIETLARIFRAFLKVINNLFNDSAAIKEAEFLSKVMSKIKTIIIVNDLKLNFNLRIEMIKFFRISYINMKLDVSKLNEYISLLVKDAPMSTDKDSSNFIFFHNLLNVRDKVIVLEDESLFLIYELKYFDKIVEKITDKKKLFQYFEDSIIVPLFVLINKYISIIDSLTGLDCQRFYLLILNFLRLKKYLLQKNQKKGNEIKQFEFSNLLVNLINTKKNKFSLIFQNMDESVLAKLDEDIAKLEEPYFSIYDYKTVYGYFEKHVRSFIKKPESKYLKNLFTKKSCVYTEDEKKELIKEHLKSGKICSEYTSKIFELIIKYENDKLNFEEGSLSINLGEKSILYDATYRSIILRPMFFLINNKKLYSKYRIQNLWHIFRLLQYDTGSTQDDILEIYNSDKTNYLNSNNPTVNINYLCKLFIQSYLAIIFSSGNPNATSTSEDYTIAYMIIKILKYLCEDHNTNFQTLFFKEIKIEFQKQSINVFELMLCTLNKIVLLAQWEKVGFNQVEDNITYFYEIFFVMIEFAIEMIQGTTKSNLRQIISVPGREDENSFFYKFLKSVKNIITNDDNDSEILYNVRLDLINFIVAFLEEKKTPEKLINLIGNLFNPLTIFNSIVKTLKKLYIKYSGQYQIKEYESIEFENKKCKYFIKKYFEDSDFSQCNEFELANRMFTYVKLLNNLGNRDAQLLIDSIEKYKEEELIELAKKKEDDDKNVLIDRNFTQNFFAVKFFEEITKSVWVQGEEDAPQMVIFTLNPTVKFLSENTKTNFYETVPRDSRSSKLFALMEYSKFFFIEINHNMRKIKGNRFLNLLNKLNYGTIEELLFVITVTINIIIAFSVKSEHAADNYKKTYNIILYFSIIQIILNLAVLISWILSKFKLYYVIEKEKYYLANKIDKDEELTVFQKVEIGLVNTLIANKETISFVWNIIFSFFGILKKKNMFLFSIQLLIIVNISPYLNNIVTALRLKYRQLFSVFLFLVICILNFSMIGFYFLSQDYIHTLMDNQENPCGSLLYCFLTHMNFGIRIDGGIGEFMSKSSYLEETAHFMGVFFFQLIFFVLIIVIILSILSAIVIDAFVELRTQTMADLKDMKDVCFICNGDRNSIENLGENFDEHITKVHNVWTYVDYIIGLKFVDPQETNAINSFVIEKIEDKKISWFPSFSNEDKEQEDNGEGDNDEDNE